MQRLPIDKSQARSLRRRSRTSCIAERRRRNIEFSAVGVPTVIVAISLNELLIIISYFLYQSIGVIFEVQRFARTFVLFDHLSDSVVGVIHPLRSIVFHFVKPIGVGLINIAIVGKRATVKPTYVKGS